MMDDPRFNDEPAMPMNIEAEQALLGVLMFDNGGFERLPDSLKALHFHEPFHQRLFEVMLAAVSAGRLAEPTLIGERLKQDPAFADFGGFGYLADLIDRAPPLSAARDFARVIEDLAVRRDLIRVGQEIVKNAPDASRPSKELLAEAENTLFTLAETGEQSKAVATFSEALTGALEQAEAAFKRDGKLAGLATQLTDLDQKLGGLHPSDLLILAGRPSMGKTALATNAAFNIARAYRYVDLQDGSRKTVEGGRVFFSSLEMSKEQLALRILSDAAGVSNDRIRKGYVSNDEMRRLHEARAELDRIPLHIDETGGINIAKLCARIRRQHRKTGLDLVVIDYLQLITTDHSKGSNRTHEIGIITGALKALAKELNVPIIALSQLSRQVEQREDKRPMLSDLRESGSIEQDADCVMFVYRESYYLGRAEPREGTEEHLKWTEAMGACAGQAEVIIGKQRHGPIGTVRLSFDEDTTRFGNLARDSDEATCRIPYGDN